MKKLLIGFGLAVVLVVTTAFLSEYLNGVYIHNAVNEPKLLIQLEGAQTAPVIAVQNSAGQLLWQVSSNGVMTGSMVNGMTTNLLVLVPGSGALGQTNTLRFSNGVLTNNVPL